MGELPYILEKHRGGGYFRKSVPCSLLKLLLLQHPLQQSFSGSWQTQLLLPVLSPKSLDYRQHPTKAGTRQAYASETKGHPGPSPASRNMLSAQDQAIFHVPVDVTRKNALSSCPLFSHPVPSFNLQGICFRGQGVSGNCSLRRT